MGKSSKVSLECGWKQSKLSSKLMEFARKEPLWINGFISLFVLLSGSRISNYFYLFETVEPVHTRRECFPKIKFSSTCNIKIIEIVTYLLLE